MPTDIVFPQNNEKEFLKIAQLLHYSILLFIYSNPKDIKKIKNQKIKINYGLLIQEKNKSLLLKKIKQAKKQNLLTLIKAQDETYNRFILEKTPADILFDLETIHPKDALHFRRSGLNQILCKIAHSQQKTIAFSLSPLLHPNPQPQTSPLNPPLILGRIIQNFSFCSKYKVKTFLGSFASSPLQMRSPHDLKALLITLNLHPKKAKESLKL